MKSYFALSMLDKTSLDAIGRSYGLQREGRSNFEYALAISSKAMKADGERGLISQAPLLEKLPCNAAVDWEV